MEARGNLMLAVQKRAFSNYFLMESSNTNQPANFIGNKVTGILFENKCDHTYVSLSFICLMRELYEVELTRGNKYLFWFKSRVH